MLRTMLVVALLGSTLGAVAQEAEPAMPDDRCWHGSQSYSAGSLVRVGGKFYACSTGTWTEAASGGANCVYEDRNYSSGALVAVREALIGCDASGAWSMIGPAEAQEAAQQGDLRDDAGSGVLQPGPELATLLVEDE